MARVLEPSSGKLDINSSTPAETKIAASATLLCVA